MSKRNSNSLLNQSRKKRRVDSPSTSFTENFSSLNDSSSDSDSSLGKILSVTLKNFMCHDNLKFDFTPNVNFIVGRNGSGKSAVLTGIILALGGKSSSTGRFSNVKGFIKTGKQTAYLAVTLCNDGERPYRHEVYGSKIIIERIITMEGSTYKIKSESGGILHTSKEELDKILDYMKIQIDNPVSILTQENSRSFLDAKNPKEKYKFFFKATELERLYQNYIHAERNRKESEKALKQRTEALPQMEKEIKKWEMIIEKASKITEYENELLWCHVIQLEKHRDELEDIYDSIKKAVKLAEDKLKLAEDKYKKTCSKLDSTKDNLIECKLEVNNLKKDVIDLNAKIKNLNDQKMELKGKLNKADREIRKNIDEISNLESSIQDIRDKSKQDESEKKMKREENISNINMKILKLKQDETKLIGQHNNLEENIKKNERNTQNLQLDNSEKNRQIDSTSKELQLLQNSANCPVNIFGSYMASLLNDIDKAAAAGHFIQKPIGPIARFVKVKEKDWTFAIEFILGGGILKSFCCDNLQDSSKLTSMIERVLPHGQHMPQIIVSPFLNQVHNVEIYKARSNHPTLFDMIECSNPVVANSLIDQSRIENILLIKNSEEAMNLMMMNPPKNCVFTILPNGDQIYPQPRYRYYSCKRRSTHLLQFVNQDYIRSKKDQLEKLKTDAKAVVQLIGSLRQQLPKLKKDISEVKGLLKTTQCSLELFEEEISRLQVVEEIKDINCLQEDLESQYAEKKRLVIEKNDLQQQFEDITHSYDKLSKQINLKKEIYKEKSTNSINLEDKVVDLEGAKENYTSEKLSLENSLQLEKNKVAPIEKDYNEAKETAEASAVNALNICPRIETTRTVKTVEAVIAETKKILEDDSKCDSKDMKAKLREKKLQFSRTEKDVEELVRITLLFQKAVANRLEGYKIIRKNTILSVKYGFIQLLQANNYTGTIKIPQDDDTLVITAKPKSSMSSCGTKELSGGEKSFVQICLLLALWDCIQMPFRMLDEYDVFMDSANRQLSLSLMIETALKDSSTQFIFLSPLELPIMEESPNIKINKMPAPKRSLQKENEST